MTTVLLHGMGQTASAWEKTQERLAQNGLAGGICCPSLFKENSPADYDSVFDAFADYAKRFTEPINLCGLSLGGIIAMDYAVRFPERVRSVIIIGVPFKIPRLLFGFQTLAFKFMPENAFAEWGLTKEKTLELTRSMKSLDIPAFAAKVRCPALILCGERDKANLSAVKPLCKAISNSVGAIVENAGHEVNIHNPALLADKINFFLNDLNKCQ